MAGTDRRQTPLQTNFAAVSFAGPEFSRCWLFVCRRQKCTTLFTKTVVQNHVPLSKSQHRFPKDHKNDKNRRKCWLFAASEPKQTTPWPAFKIETENPRQLVKIV